MNGASKILENNFFFEFLLVKGVVSLAQPKSCNQIMCLSSLFMDPDGNLKWLNWFDDDLVKKMFIKYTACVSSNTT